MDTLTNTFTTGQVLTATALNALVTKINELVGAANSGGSAVTVVNNLTSDSTTSALSAKQGKALAGLISSNMGLTKIVSYDNNSWLSTVFNACMGGYPGIYCTTDDEGITYTAWVIYSDADNMKAIFSADDDLFIGYVDYTESDNTENVAFFLSRASADTYYAPKIGTHSSTALVANKISRLGTLTAAKTITLGGTYDNTAEYMLEFSTGSTAYSITWNITDLKWAGGTAPTIKANKTYFVSILNKLAVVGEF